MFTFRIWLAFSDRATRRINRARKAARSRLGSNRYVSIIALIWAIGCLPQPLLSADDLPPADSIAQPNRRIDRLIDSELLERGITPAGLCDDATFLRRASLDLTGRHPLASEVVEFLRNSDPNKRSILIDRLLESPACAVHLANTWSAWLLPEMQTLELPSGRNGLHAWLRNRFANNLRYDRLVADLLAATGSTNAGPGTFFVALEGKPEKIAAKTARVFLGVQLDCAECHDHPFDHWKQQDFWGFAAYFARLSANGMQAQGGMVEISDRSEGEVMLPNTSTVVSPQPLVSTGLSGLESGTRRQQLTLWLTARENPYLARAAVNRCWSLLFGRGLIEPIDDMRSLDMASHPELLQELATDFSANGFDVRRLFRTLANSNAYQRRNDRHLVPPSDQHTGDDPRKQSYANMMVKPMTSTQLAACILQVAREVTSETNLPPFSVSATDRLAQQLGQLRGESSTATLGIVQALVTLHSRQLDRVHEQSQSRLLLALTAPHLTPEKRIEWMFLSTLCRPPRAEELEGILKLNASQPKDTEPVSTHHADLLWALINSTEFAMTP